MPDSTPGAGGQPLAILVHGMGRTPLSMALLAHRLRREGFRSASFGYVAAFERTASCVSRLQRFIDARIGAAPYIVVGHSLGTVLLRCALPRLSRQPAACFLLTPPARACLWAKRCAPLMPYRLATGEMGQRLADEDFMRSVPAPACPTWVYAGTAGPRKSWFPLAGEPNDGVLMLSETQIAGVPTIPVPALHTFFMNSRFVARDLVAKAHAALRQAASRAANEEGA